MLIRCAFAAIASLMMLNIHAQEFHGGVFAGLNASQIYNDAYIDRPNKLGMQGCLLEGSSDIIYPGKWN